MNNKKAVAAVLWGALTLAAGQAQAAPEPQAMKTEVQPSAREFGPTLPPVGFVNFCLATPNECTANFGLFGSGLLAMTPAHWQQLKRVNADVNHAIEPMSDQDIYGKVEVWALPKDNQGDCEDYVLLKKRNLMSLGFPQAALRITVVLDERGDGHAVLTLAATDGDYVLDNRRDAILRWSDTKYTFVKRQSEHNPRQWVALRRNATMAYGGLSASQAVEPASP
jgi:predicted transglutaminase-like cysteine proteinase